MLPRSIRGRESDCDVLVVTGGMVTVARRWKTVRLRGVGDPSKTKGAGNDDCQRDVRW